MLLYKAQLFLALAASEIIGEKLAQVGVVTTDGSRTWTPKRYEMMLTEIWSGTPGVSVSLQGVRAGWGHT